MFIYSFLIKTNIIMIVWMLFYKILNLDFLLLDLISCSLVFYFYNHAVKFTEMYS